MNDATSSNLSIYMDGRGLLQPTQTLTVDGTDMRNYYVNGSFGGTANISLVNGAMADLVEAGGSAIGPATNVNIVVDGSVLNGAQTDRIYDIANSDNKNFTLGSAIFVYLTDRGNRAISVANGSELHGSIVTGTTGIGATQSVSITVARSTTAAFCRWLPWRKYRVGD